MRSFTDLEDSIKRILRDPLKFNLKSWGVTKSDLDDLVELSFTKGRMENNIVDLSKEEVLQILESIL